MSPRGARATNAALAAAALLLVAAALSLVRADGAPAMPAVVTVEVGGELATGFVRDGRVVTVAHVLAPGRPVRVRGDDGARPATVARSDAATDVALLDVPGLRAQPAAPVGATSILVRRDGRVTALPVAIRRRFTARVTHAGDRAGPPRPALELEADVDAGDSGAPVVAPGGRLLGVVFARSARRPRTAYALRLSP
jgi:S1-C subfamily serine protease